MLGFFVLIWTLGCSLNGRREKLGTSFCRRSNRCSFDAFHVSFFPTARAVLQFMMLKCECRTLNTNLVTDLYHASLMAAEASRAWVKVWSWAFYHTRRWCKSIAIQYLYSERLRHFIFSGCSLFCRGALCWSRSQLLHLLHYDSNTSSALSAHSFQVESDCLHEQIAGFHFLRIYFRWYFPAEKFVVWLWLKSSMLQSENDLN